MIQELHAHPPYTPDIKAIVKKNSRNGHVELRENCNHSLQPLFPHKRSPICPGWALEGRLATYGQIRP